MSDLHIDEFFADAARVIATLYGVFPRPVTLYVEDICGPDEPDEYGVHSPRHLACLAAMQWLGTEGYLNFSETIRTEAIDQAVLTGRCFSHLIRPQPTDANKIDATLPASVRTSQTTTIFAIEQAIKARSTNQLTAAFKTLLFAMSASQGR